MGDGYQSGTVTLLIEIRDQCSHPFHHPSQASLQVPFLSLLFFILSLLSTNTSQRKIYDFDWADAHKDERSLSRSIMWLNEMTESYRSIKSQPLFMNGWNSTNLLLQSSRNAGFPKKIVLFFPLSCKDERKLANRYCSQTPTWWTIIRSTL